MFFIRSGELKKDRHAHNHLMYPFSLSLGRSPPFAFFVFMCVIKNSIFYASVCELLAEETGLFYKTNITLRSFQFHVDHCTRRTPYRSRCVALKKNHHKQREKVVISFHGVRNSQQLCENPSFPD